MYNPAIDSQGISPERPNFEDSRWFDPIFRLFQSARVVLVWAASPEAVPARGSGPGCLGSVLCTPAPPFASGRDTPRRGRVSTLVKQSALEPTSGDFALLNEDLRTHLQTRPCGMSRPCSWEPLQFKGRSETIGKGRSSLHPGTLQIIKDPEELAFMWVLLLCIYRI